MEMVWIKVVNMILQGSLSYAVGFLPLFVFPRIKRRSSSGDIVLSCFLCFGCGVLMATVFTHLFPEVVDSLKEAEKEGFISLNHYPLGEVIMCCGFLLIYLLEEIAVTIAGEHVHGGKENKNRSVSCSLSNEGVRSCSIRSHEISINDAKKEITTVKERRASSIVSESRMSSFKRRHRENSVSSLTLHVIVDHEIDGSDQTVSSSTIDQPGTLATGFRNVLVVLALSYHAIFEGLAVGLQENASDLWLLTAAVLSHKLVIVFSVGMELLEEGVRRRTYIIYISAFASAMPLGILVGILVTYYTTAETAAGMLTVTVLQGISGGTILYVAFCEVLERERNRPDRSQQFRYLQLLSLSLGFALLAGLEAVGGHSHGHGHGDEHSSDNTTEAEPVLFAD
ncbi:zinc transporter ZIP1-like [Oratosquilla oratoria]|uniref:zinc transporter ZIP1-like n=1 Tax=Oratosquilla oratoria TaxID=337810 RepID=UPI003F7737BE